MDIGQLQTTLSEDELNAVLGEIVKEGIDSGELPDELKGEDVTVTPTANMGGLGEVFVLAIVGAIGKRVGDALWDYVVRKLEDRRPGKVTEAKKTT